MGLGLGQEHGGGDVLGSEDDAADAGDAADGEAIGVALAQRLAGAQVDVAVVVPIGACAQGKERAGEIDAMGAGGRELAAPAALEEKLEVDVAGREFAPYAQGDLVGSGSRLCQAEGALLGIPITSGGLERGLAHSLAADEPDGAAAVGLQRGGLSVGIECLDAQEAQVEVGPDAIAPVDGEEA